MLDVRRKDGRANYGPLWWVRGGEAWTPTVNEKNANTMFAFFSSSLPTATAEGCSSPFEALKDGFATGMTAGSGESKPLLLHYERGKPGGEGEGRYMPPLIHHLTTIGLKVGRPLVGLVR